MSARPDDIHIGDLANPELSEMQEGVLTMMSANPPTLTEEAVLGAALERTGLHDFGPEDFRERLSVWLEAVNEDSELGPMGRTVVFNDCVRYASNRLRLEDLVEKHPEVLEVEIKAPIIVGGLPRSGTTHLLNLIAADERLRSLPYWESLEPIPAPTDAHEEGEEDPRLTRCRQVSALQDQIMPLLPAMHHMAPEHVHEEIELQAIDFSSYILEWNAMVPRWRDYYLAHDQRSSYAYLKKALQALQWLKGPERWILKSPQHLEQLGPLMETFPDATLVLTHRDPVSVIQSAITMLAYGDRMRRTRVNPKAVADYWIDRVERMLRACVRDRELIPADKSIDVLFHEFMADDIATVGRIYDLAGLPLTGRARQQFDDYMQANPRGKHGRVVYDLEGDFGVNPDALRERFGFYFERFPIRAEK